MIVVKVGGDLLNNEILQGLLLELAELKKENAFILIHGGGDIVTEISEKLGHPPKFVLSPKGFKSRYTDKETSMIYMMVMAGKINKEIVLMLQKNGVQAIGLSGLDGGLVMAARKTKIVSMDERGRKILMDGGYTGQIKEVDAELLAKVQALKATCPQTKIVALAEEWKEGRDPNAEGVDMVLRRGVSPARLTKTLSEILGSTAGAEPPARSIGGDEPAKTTAETLANT